MDVVEIWKKHEVSIPQEVFSLLGLEVGGFLQVSLKVVYMTPVQPVPKSQLWFWTEGWQKKEKEADEDIEEGRLKEFKTVKELVKELSE